MADGDSDEVALARAAAYQLVYIHNLGDYVYNVRERAGDDAHFEGNSWEHPLVKCFSNAVETLREFADRGPQPAPVPVAGTLERAWAAIAEVPPNWHLPAAASDACPNCGSLPGADTSWRMTDEHFEHTCPLLPPQVGHLRLAPACQHCGARPGYLHQPECKRPRPPEPPDRADVRREALEQAAKLCEHEAAVSGSPARQQDFQRMAGLIRGLGPAQ